MPTHLHRSELDHLQPLDIIFNCGICHDSLRDIYAASEDNKGFGDGRDVGQTTVNKFWIAECGHLICAKHIEGGGRGCAASRFDTFLIHNSRSRRALLSRERATALSMPGLHQISR